MGPPKGSKNALGNKGGRQYPQRTLEAFWKELDTRVLPLALKYCRETIEYVVDNHPDDKEWRSLGIQASKVAFSRAPERIAGHDGGAIQAPVVYLPKQDE